MSWNLDKSKPICPQICELLSVKIASGEYIANQKLMSVREVALQAGVNPNTVQKAFEQLESHGLIYSVRGSGWFVDANGKAETTVEKLQNEKIAEFFYEMHKLGLTSDQIKNYVREWNE